MPVETEENPAPTAPPRRRRWKWIKRIVALGLGGLVCWSLFFVAMRDWNRREGESALARARAEVESTDPDWTWEALNAKRPRPPETKNGADLIPRIKKQLPANWGKGLTKEQWQEELEPPPNVRHSPALIAQVRRELDASADALALARKLRDCPFGHREIVLAPNVLDTLLPDTQHSRTVVILLKWAVVIDIEEGNGARGTEDLHALLNASRSIGDDPFLISQLVRMEGRTVTVQTVERVLAQSPDVPNLKGLQAALAADAEEPLLLYGVRGERATFDRLLENLQSGAASIDSLSKGGPTSNSKPGERWPLGWWSYRANIPGERAFALEWFSKYVEAARRPIHEQADLIAKIPPPLKDERHVLTRLLLPAADKVAEGHWHKTALERCAVVGIACERFRQRNARWPDAVGELVPAYLPEVVLDPYVGKPLCYEKTETGAVVYSVGTRPGTRIVVQQTDAPTGFPPGVEFGFRLWNPELRRVPPPEKPQPEDELPP